MKKEIRKTFRLSEDEYQQMNALMNELDFVENFSQLIIYLFHYFVKNRNTEEYNRKILQDVSRKVELNEKFLLQYMKIIAKSQIENLDNAKLEIEKEFENEMKSRLVKKNFELH